MELLTYTPIGFSNASATYDRRGNSPTGILLRREKTFRFETTIPLSDGSKAGRLTKTLALMA
jgi:hypothetical protein